MRRLYKRVLAGCILLWLAASGLLADVEVPVAVDLQQDGAQAGTRQLPILLSFSALECSYCDLLEEEFLKPMLLGGEYSDRIIIRKLILDNGSRVGDFSGEHVYATRLADRYRIYVTPTILFLDAGGRELAERMVGINTPEMFGGYLDNCIETALLSIRDPDRLADLHGCQLPPEQAFTPAMP